MSSMGVKSLFGTAKVGEDAVVHNFNESNG